MKRYENKEAVLKEVFGYSGFKGFQGEVIEHVLAGGDALVLMPTGGGKSLCYQIPALLMDGVTVVVCPLLSLMQDQVVALEATGVSAAYMNSTQTQEELEEVRSKLLSGAIDILYLSPERLTQPGTQNLLRQVGVNLFAIDEAHCVSEWGHDFRPEYGELSLMKELFPEVPRLAVTASADERTCAEIHEKLLLNAKDYKTSFARKNLFYRVVEKKGLKKQLVHFIKTEHKGECGIVYCSSRRKTEELAEHLRSEGIKALCYHAGLTQEERSVNQQRFLVEDDLVMVATVAFGMGINKPNVRFVAHVDMPKSPEAYLQQIGRAGRDGLIADAWMAVGLTDAMSACYLIDQSEADEHYKEVLHQKLRSMMRLAETGGCREQALLSYFGQTSGPCGHCDNCLSKPDVEDVTRPAQKLLSCVYRVQQKSRTSFGANHIIDVLRGSMTGKVRDWNHHELSTWSIGRDWSQARWRRLVRVLLANGYLWIDTVNNNVLRLGPDVMPLLKGQASLSMRVSEEKEPVRKVSGNPWDELTGEDRDVYNDLVLWRNQFAMISKKQKWQILTNATLIEIAQTRPTSEYELGGIQGIGAYKLEHYGPDLLAIVNRYR